MKVQVYVNGWGNGFRWRLISRNGRILAQSSEDYTKRAHCVRMARMCCPTARLEVVS